MPAKQYWLLKTEPSSFSIDDLAKQPKKTTSWEGVRNYQARNMLRDQIKKGDGILFYHSGANPPAVVGTARVVRDRYPDHFAWDRKSKYYDPQSTPDDPRWFMVDIQLASIFPRPVSLSELREIATLSKMELLRKGSRLSVQPVRPAEFDTICKLGSRKR